VLQLRVRLEKTYKILCYQGLLLFTMKNISGVEESRLF
jgi:hypothetical protein